MAFKMVPVTSLGCSAIWSERRTTKLFWLLKTNGRGIYFAVVWPSAGGSAQTTQRMQGFVLGADFAECI